ncbi:hypothetical protein [Magnetospira thiophila]
MERDLTPSEKKELTAEEKEYKSKRKLVQEKLIKFATRIPAFMYLTDFRENTLQDVITKLEPDLFLAVTGLTVADFHLLVRLKVFNTEQMNQTVFAFLRGFNFAVQIIAPATRCQLHGTGESMIKVCLRLSEGVSTPSPSTAFPS